MPETVSFRVDFETTEAQNNVEALADATEVAMNQMEDASQSSLTASSQDIERLGDVFRQVGGDIETAIREVIVQQDQLAKQTRATADSGSFLSNAFSTVGSVLTTVGSAVAATYGAIGVLVQTTTQAIVETDNYAKTLGISTEAMQTFEFAMQRAGGDTDALREGIRTAQEAVAEFVTAGSGPAAEALQVLGVQLTDTSGRVRSMEELFPELVTAIGSVQDPAERTRLAIQLFGEEDSVLIATMGQNPQVFDEARSAAKRFGITLSADLVGQSRQFQTGVTDLLASLQGLGQELVSALLPTLNQLLPQFTAWVASLRESDTVQKELIPTIQAIIGYLGEVGTVVTVLQDIWAALNVAFNAVVMAILEGVGVIAQGLGTIIAAAGTAADFLGMDGVAEKLKTAGAAVTAVGDEADKMGDIARETMQEWQASLSTTTDSLGTTRTATVAVTTATEQLGTVTKAQAEHYKAMGVAGVEAGQKVLTAQEFLTQEQQKHDQAVQETNKAYKALGIQSSATLQALADQAVQQFETIRKSGTATPEELARIWTEKVVPQIIAAYDTLPDKFKATDTAILKGAQQTTTEVRLAYERLGLDIPKATRQAAVQAIEDFQTIATSGTASFEELHDYYTTTTVPTIEAATGRLAPSFAQVMGQIDERLRTTNAHMGSNTRETIELINGFWTNMKVTATEALNDTGSLADRILRQTRANVTATLGPVSQLVKDLGITTSETNRKTADAAIENLQLLVAAFGLYSEEVKQGAAAMQDDIKRGYDLLPPHIERILRLATDIHKKGAGDSAKAHEDGVQRIVESYEAGFRRINGIIQATTGVIDNSGFEWGTTLEELQAQLRQTQQELNQLSNTSGSGSAVYLFLRERLLQVVGELSARIRELRDDAEATTQTTDTLTTRLGRGTEQATDFAGALAGVGSAAQQAAGALGSFTAAQAAVEGSERLDWLAPGAASHRPATTTGGTGSGGGGSGRGDGGGRGGGGDSLTIGLPPGHLPPGVPLPSDLGIPNGGTGYDPYGLLGPNAPGRGSTVTTNNTIVNVNEPITLQTRADTSALTSQAIMDALNEALRRGILQPQLSTALQGALRRGGG